MKKNAMIVSSAEEHSDLDTSAFWKFGRSLKELKTASFDEQHTTVSYRGGHCWRYDIINTLLFVVCVHKNYRKSTRAIVRKLQVDEATIRCAIREYVR